MNRTITKNMPDRTWPGIITPALSTDNLQGGSDKTTTGINQQRKIKTINNTTTIGTWNVRTLQPCGKLEGLEHELEKYRWHVIGLAEVRWKGTGERKTDNGNVIWYSGRKDKHKHGVTFIVKKEIEKSVINVEYITSRIIYIRIAATPMNISIIQVYAPTADYEDEIIEEFYEQIENTIARIPKKDFMIIQGDWNAKVGSDGYIIWYNATGRYGLVITN